MCDAPDNGQRGRSRGSSGKRKRSEDEQRSGDKNDCASEKFRNNGYFSLRCYSVLVS